MNIHVTLNGEGWDLDGDALDIGAGSSDTDIRTAAAEALNVPVTKLSSFTIRRTDEEITLYPPATFG